MLKYKVKTSQLVSAAKAYLIERNRFNRLQLYFIFLRWIDLSIFDKKAEKLLNDILCLFVRLDKNSKNYYLLGDVKFALVEEDMIRHIVGMYIDIMIKDKYFDTPVTLEDHKKILFDYYQEDAYENEFVQVKKSDVVIDAGANMGVFSVLAAKKGAKVYAFEPQPYFNSILCKNISLNQFDETITPIRCGISDHKGQFPMSIDRGNLLSASITIERGNDSCMIDCISIDEWVEENNIERVDFIKVDIEGAERLLLKGARKTILKFKPKIAISSYHYPDDPEVLKEIINSFNCNYQISEAKKIIYAYCVAP